MAEDHITTRIRPMKVLHVNNVDLQGRRFNGYDLLTALQGRGIEGRQAVLAKMSRNERVTALPCDPRDVFFNAALERVESRHGMNNLLYPWGRLLRASREFNDADVVHYHLIHNSMISLLDLPELMRLKPSVWTFHDPWPLTGHCVYPRDCTGWLTGCEACGHLDWFFPMQRDCAGRMWRVKERVYSELDVDIVVASEYMREMVARSPLTAHFERVHLIPFGIESDWLLPNAERASSRASLGIPNDHFVLFFRSTPAEVKGLRFLIEALQLRSPARPTTLLTVDCKGLLHALTPEYNIVELGWVEDDDLYPQLFAACDAFVMPSIAEAFGLMALEAMTAGRPVVCFGGTSLPSVTHAPKVGVAVPLGDVAALRAAIDHLALDSGDARRRGELGRGLAMREYSHDLYLERLADLYVSAYERRRQ